MSKNINEVSANLLDRYKAKAKKSADDLASKGQYRQSTNRWANIMKATGKQIEKTTADIKKNLNREEVELDEDLSKMSTEKLKKHWDSHKDQTGASPVFAAQLKKVAKELAKRKALKEDEELDEGTFKYHMDKAIAAAERGDDKKKTYHLDNARTAKFAMKTADYAKNRELLAKHKQMSEETVIGEAKEKTEYDYEGDMARGQLRSILANAKQVHDMLKPDTNIAEWVQSKITLAADYISTVADYMQSEVNEEAVQEGYAEDDIANGGTVIYKHEGKHYMSKVSHKTGGGAGTKIHTTSKLGHVVPLNHVVSTDASDWNKFKGLTEGHRTRYDDNRTGFAKREREDDEYHVPDPVDRRSKPMVKDEPHAVHINGKKWKSFGSQSHATNVAKKIKGATVHKEEKEQVDEKLKPSMGAGKYIKDFEKSDAPQFKGKSKEKKRVMGIAAFLSAKKGMNESSTSFEKDMDSLNKARLQKLKSQKKVDDFKAQNNMEEVEQIEEAVTVKKANYSWGKMITVHKGADTSYPLHPEHQAAIKRLRPSGEHSKTHFKDETGRMVHATREGDKVHLVSHGANSDKTTVDYKHFDESNMKKTFNQFMDDLDEGRGRPRKNPTDPKWSKGGKAKSSDDEEHEYGGQDSGKEPDQHIHVQLSKAKDAAHHEVKGKEGFKTKGGADVKFDKGTHFVKSEHAKSVLDALSKVKPETRNELHAHIAKSHDNFMQVHKMVSGGK